jgi:hypothetical protein
MAPIRHWPIRPLAQSLAALYPPATDERRWAEGDPARKKEFGL